MPQGRHDYPAAIHLLRVQGRRGNAIFFPAEILRDLREVERNSVPDVEFWESLMVRVCDRHGARVHGYTWLPNDAFLLIQRFAVPLRIILPTLLGQYSRHLHEIGSVPLGISPYRGRCESMEVTPDLLPYAVRYIYGRPVKAGLCTTPLEYPFCSRNLHFARRVPHWFEVQEFLDRMKMRGHVGRMSIEQFLVKPESPRHAQLFERISARGAQIAGEPTDIDESMWLASSSPPAPSIKQVADTVATILRLNALPLATVLASALTTWYATRTGAATLAQMGFWFDREATTLRADIESHRRQYAKLFELSNEELLELIRRRISRDARPTMVGSDGGRVTKRRRRPRD